MSIRVQGHLDAVETTTATLTGTQSSSSASARLTIPASQPCVISATASFTVVAAAGTSPVFVRGEEVERVQVSTSWDGVSRVAYFTKSGRDVTVPGR